MQENCGKCTNCLDMPRFGGLNRLRQACLGRKCVNMAVKVKKVKEKWNTGGGDPAARRPSRDASGGSSSQSETSDTDAPAPPPGKRTQGRKKVVIKKDFSKENVGTISRTDSSLRDFLVTSEVEVMGAEVASRPAAPGAEPKPRPLPNVYPLLKKTKPEPSQSLPRYLCIKHFNCFCFTI